MLVKIQIKNKAFQLIYTLNESPAAKSFYEQLPLTVPVKNYSDDEKIFYPNRPLDVEKTPAAKALNGTLAYYAPWGDVVLLYKDFGSATGLYALGEIVEGKEHIAKLDGELTISKYE